jgi:cytochrome c5
MIRPPRTLAALAIMLALGACQDSAPDFAPMDIVLPQDSIALPDRPGVEAVTANCTACHSADMILNQPALTRAQWQSTLTKMREVYKASIDSEAETAILDYLEAQSAGVTAAASRPAAP